MRVHIVVIVAENNAIGKDNALLCHLPDDMKRFKSLTMGKPVIAGRKTYDSIGKPLPGRRNIVISRQAGLKIAGCEVVGSFVDALSICGEASDVAVIGGAEIYRLALPLTDTIHLTRLHATLEGDVFFPSLDPSQWREVACEEHAADERHRYAFAFVTLERIRSAH